jgi:hypothetical protein
MRYVIPAMTLALVLAAPSASSAQSGQSMQASFSACVDLAKQRGWSAQDLDENRPAARKFVISCMQGGRNQAKSTRKTKQN